MDAAQGCDLFPSLDRFWTNQCRPAAFRLVAHVQRVAVGEIFGNVPVIGKRDVRTLSRQADAVSVVFKSMGKQSSAGFLAATHDGKQHCDPSENKFWAAPTMGERADRSNPSRLWNREDACGIVRINLDGPSTVSTYPYWGTAWQPAAA